MLNTKEEFVYTDMLNDINKKLLDKFNYCTVDKIRSIRPKKGFDRKKEEIVVWNFKQKDIFNIWTYHKNALLEINPDVEKVIVWSSNKYNTNKRRFKGRIASMDRGRKC